MVQGAESCQSFRTTETVEENLYARPKCIPQQGSIFQCKAWQEEEETLDEYWKRLVDIERKCEFNRITPEEIITYKFVATIHNKKAQDKFIKGPL